MKILKVIFWGSALLFTSLQASATLTPFDNLAAISDGSDSVAESNFGPLSASFLIASPRFVLTDVKLKLTGDNSTGGSLTVSLLADNGTAPGSLVGVIGSLADSALSFTATDFSFVLATPWVLAQNARYWIQVSSTSDSSAAWSYSSDISGAGVATEYHANAYLVYDNASSSPYQLQVNGTVPEPATAWLLSLGLMGLPLAKVRGSTLSNKA